MTRVTPRGDWLADPSKLDSPGFATLRRFKKTFGSMTPRGMIPRQDGLRAVWYPGELDSLGYHTPRSDVLADFLLTPWGIIPRQVNKKSAKTWLPNLWYPGESCFNTAFLGKIWLFYSLYLLNLMRYCRTDNIFLASAVSLEGFVSPLVRFFCIFHYSIHFTLEWSPIQVLTIA